MYMTNVQQIQVHQQLNYIKKTFDQAGTWIYNTAEVLEWHERLHHSSVTAMLYTHKISPVRDWRSTLKNWRFVDGYTDICTDIREST